MYTQPLTEGQYFHIYNRGVNSENIFKTEENYYHFLNKYFHYCSDVFETLAYVLLKNHFHMLIHVKENIFVPKQNGQGFIQLTASKQLSHFFNSYAQSINKASQRTGQLFESSFERKLVDNDNYITSLIYYCHYNPQRHGFVKDFKDWQHSSYHSILKNDNTFLASQKVLDWFGGKDNFIKAHEGRLNDIEISKFIVE
jgi:putative transposase